MSLLISKDLKEENSGSLLGVKRKSGALILQEEDEEEDEDEALPAAVSVSAEATRDQSIEYVEARQNIERNPWDVNSWMVLIDEVRSERAGGLGAVEACEMFLKQFPRSAQVWQIYCEALIKEGEIVKAEEMYKKCIRCCRSPALWRSYLLFMKGLTVGKALKTEDSYQTERKNLELIFEQALDNIGLAVDSHIIWKMYLDFVSEWPDKSALDSGRKLAAQRKIYQRCLRVPSDGLDTFWKEYSALEKGVGEHLAEQLLPEYNEKYLAAKGVHKDRKRLVSQIDFHRLGRLPLNDNVQELEQLNHWNSYIAFERGLVESMDTALYKTLMNMVYDQCLCCFRHYPEVWLSFLEYSKSTLPAGSSVLPLRAICREAVATIPNCAALRIAWSEIEEEFGSSEVAKDILRQAYELVPTSFSFACLQSFIYRKDGKSAARKCFSETMPLRRDRRLGIEVYLAHAELELNRNREPETALKILQLARTECNMQDVGEGSHVASHCIDYHIGYIRLNIRVLLQLGEIDKLRYLFHIAFSSLHASLNLNSERPSTTIVGSSLPVVLTAVANEEFMKTQWILWEEYYNIENTFGTGDIARLNSIRHNKNLARNSFLEKYGNGKKGDLIVGYPSIGNSLRYVGFTVNPSVVTELVLDNRSYGLFTPSLLLFERYDASSFGLLTNNGQYVADSQLKQRCRGAAYLDEVEKAEYVRKLEISEGMSVRKKGVDVEGLLRTLNAPPLFAQFITKLPERSNLDAFPDIEGFLEHLRRAVLPPRPYSDVESESLYTPNVLSMVEDEEMDEDANDVFVERQRNRQNIIN